MPVGELLLWLLAVVAGLGLYFYAASLVEKRRSGGVAALAARRGWTFTAKDRDLTAKLQGEPLGRLRPSSARNVCAGVHDGRGFLAFDYWIRMGNTSTCHAMVLVDLGTVDLPHLVVTPRAHVVDRFFRGRGPSDPASGDPQFDDAYLVRSTVPEVAAEVLGSAVRQWLLFSAYSIEWRLRGDRLLLVQSGRVDAASIDRALLTASQILDHIPEDRWRKRP